MNIQPITPVPHDATELDLCDKIIDLLPEDKCAAMNLLASVAEACIIATEEPLEIFISRIVGWKAHRP